MIKTDHQKVLSLEYYGCFQTLFSKIIKGDWDPECFQDNKNFITVIDRISEFNSLFVCKVSVGSDW